MNQLSSIPGLGPKTREKLAKLKINSDHDLLYHFPHRYLDFSHITPIVQVRENDSVTIHGKIINFKNIFTRQSKNLQTATVADATGQLSLIWFNQPYLAKNILINSTYSFAGTVSLYHQHPTIIAPEYGQYNTGKIIAVYPETSGLSSKWFRKTIQTQINSLISGIHDPLPSNILHQYQFLPLTSALHQIHSPDNHSSLLQARSRLALDEILSLQAESYLKKALWLTKKPQFVLNLNPLIAKKITAVIKSLPFTLTSGQKHAWLEILADLISPSKVTNRLLQGDVGSGKTVVAALAAYLTHLNHHLSLFLCPTEILAQQHFATIQKILPKVPIILLTSHTKLSPTKISPNTIIIATHAALFHTSRLQDQIGLLIIDEQHKFGVQQRSVFTSSLHPPHTLTMTATPIPRTISLTLLGNLDLSIIDTMPKDRLPVKTFLVPNHKKHNCYDWIRGQINQHHCQCFIVCPFIDISETMASIKSAVAEFEILTQQIFPDLKLALIHGKTPTKSRQETLTKFKNNHISILVTTPIIEVGIDFPNTTVILIQSADRFGLAQLHQLRGRVGRGDAQSYCYLFTDSENEKSTARLKFLENHHHGLEIANFDLKTRGPGETFSTIQHGFPSLKLADLSDLKLITLSRQILTDLLRSHPDFNLNSLVSIPSHSTPTLTN